MKVGDLVEPYENFKIEGIDYGIGVILDSYEDRDGLLFFEVQCNHQRQWFGQDEIKVISEIGVLREL